MMEIDYNQLAVNAARRSEELQAFAKKAGDLELRACELMQALEYFAALGQAARAMDSETKSHLPNGVGHRAVVIGEFAEKMLYPLTHLQPSGSNAAVMSALIEATKK